MKKFYAAAAAALFAASAFAQAGAPLYLVGNGEGLGWDPAAPAEFTYAEGVYTAEIANLVEFKMSPAMGDWDAFNAAALGVEEYGKDQLGTAVALIASDQNIKAPWKGDYKIVVAGDLSTVTLTTSTPEPTGPTPIFLRGDMNSWGASEEWQLTQASDNLYTLTCAEGLVITAADAFKIADADWGTYNFGAADAEPFSLEFDNQMLAGSNDNCKLDEEWNGVLYFDMENSYLWMSNDKTAKPDWWTVGVESIEAAAEAPVFFNLQGVRVANPEKGVFVRVAGNKAEKVVL